MSDYLKHSPDLAHFSGDQFANGQKSADELLTTPGPVPANRIDISGIKTTDLSPEEQILLAKLCTANDRRGEGFNPNAPSYLNEEVFSLAALAHVHHNLTTWNPEATQTVLPWPQRAWQAHGLL